MLWIQELAEHCYKNQIWKVWISFSRDNGLPFWYFSFPPSNFNFGLSTDVYSSEHNYVFLMFAPMTGCLNGGGQIKPNPGQSAKDLIQSLEATYAENVSLILLVSFLDWGSILSASCAECLITFYFVENNVKIWGWNWWVRNSLIPNFQLQEKEENFQCLDNLRISCWPQLLDNFLYGCSELCDRCWLLRLLHFFQVLVADPFENPGIKRLYSEWLGQPGSEKAKRHLYTEYHPVVKSISSQLQNW